jgi:hypothetical protein
LVAEGPVYRLHKPRLDKDVKQDQLLLEQIFGNDNPKKC